MAPTPMMRLKVRVRIARGCYHRTLRGPAGLLLALAIATPARAAGPWIEAWVRIPPPLDGSDVDAVLVRTEQERLDPDGARVVRVLARDLVALEARGIEVRELLPAPRPPPPGYRPPAEGDALLADLVTRSARAGTVRIGTSSEGRPLEALWVGVLPGAGAPALRVVGGHHGDEPISSELVLALAEHLVDGDGADVRVTRILDRSTVWLVPYVNPDGVVRGTRLDADGVDLNRNYDFAWRADAAAAGPEPFSQPETRAVRALGDLERPLLGLTVHAGATNLGWPWNHTTEDAPDADAFELLGQLYARECTTGDFWLTQGGDWYVTAGDLDDWAYGRHGDLHFTLEVAVEGAPSDPEDVVAEHLDALLALLDLPPAVAGTVVDAGSGRPVEAELRLDDRAPFRTDATGVFHRLVPPGTATLTVSAPGYAPASVAVEPGRSTDLALALEPEALVLERVEPAVLRTPGRVSFPTSGTVRLERPGADPVTVAAGEALDPSELAPGAWTAVLPDGAVLPRALFVDGPEPGVRLDGWDLSDGVACVRGDGFAEGARAWALWGIERAQVELPVLSVAPGEVCVAVDAVPADADPDLHLWTAGARLGIDHLWDPRALGDPFDGERIVAVGGCGCAAVSGHRAGSALSIVFVGWGVARRRRRGGR